MKQETIDKIKNRIQVIQDRLDSGYCEPAWFHELEACKSTLQWVLRQEGLTK